MNNNTRKFVALLIVFALVFISGCSNLGKEQQTEAVPTREDAGIKYQVDLSSLCESEEAFPKKVDELKNTLSILEANLDGFNSKEEFRGFCEEFTKVNIESDKLYLYADLRKSVDQSDTKAKEMATLNDDLAKRIQELLVKATEKMEASLDVESFIETDYYIENKSVFDLLIYPITEKKEMNLSDEVFELASQNSLLDSSFEDIYINLTTSENPGETNEEIINTLALIYLGEMKKNQFTAKLYGYDSILEYELAMDDMTLQSYENLIKSTNEYLPAYQKFLRLQDKMYALEEAYNEDGKDLYKNVKTEYKYEEAADIILEGLSYLGKDYTKNFKTLVNGRMIDVYPGQNKETGAYAINGYEGNPYIIMNYDNTFYSLLTLAHESGHAIHGIYSRENNSYYDSNYSIFTTEVASTSNELLVNRYLLDKAKSDEEKLFLLSNLISTLAYTTFDQVSNSEFERDVYEAFENGEPISAEVMNEIAAKQLKKYMGKGYEDYIEENKLWWSNIPHFYDAFYTYQYATSIAAANLITKDIIAGKEGSLDSYIKFLSSGAALDNMQTMEIISANMEDKKTYDQVYQEIDKLNDEMEKIINKLGKDYPEV